MAITDELSLDQIKQCALFFMKEQALIHDLEDEDLVFWVNDHEQIVVDQLKHGISWFEIVDNIDNVNLSSGIN